MFHGKVVSSWYVTCSGRRTLPEEQEPPSSVPDPQNISRVPPINLSVVEDNTGVPS